MDTFEIRRDIVFDEVPWIILDEASLKRLKEAAGNESDKDTRAAMKAQTEALESERKRVKDSIRCVTVTAKRPNPALRVDIQAACRDKQGLYHGERLPLELCKQLITAWDLADKDGKAIAYEPGRVEDGTMPMCLFDAVAGELYGRMFPSEARLPFFGQWGSA